jgi:PAS domain S-box-containing protein
MLSRLSVLSLLAIGLLVICGQFSVQQGLFRQSHDASVINIAGLQRALSEKLSRCALAIDIATTAGEVERYSKELEQETRQFAAQHEALQFGSADLQIPDTASVEIREMFAQEVPYYNLLLRAARALVAEERSLAYAPRAVHAMSSYTKEILENQPKFYKLMNEMVSRYESEAEMRGEQLETSQLSFVLTTILALLLLGVVILRPAINQIRASIADLENTQLRLSDNEFRLAAIINSMAEGLIVMDAEGNITLVNEAARRIHRMNDAEIDLKKWFEQYTFYEDDRKSALAFRDLPLVKALRGEQVDNKQLYLQHESDQEGLWVVATARPLRGVQNKIIGGLVVMQDITERKKWEQDFEQLNRTFDDELLSPLRSISDIFADLSSELSNQGVSDKVKALLDSGTKDAKRLARMTADVQTMQGPRKEKDEKGY